MFLTELKVNIFSEDDDEVMSTRRVENFREPCMFLQATDEYT